MTFSGFIDLWRLTKTDKTSILMWPNSDIQIAEEFKKISQPTNRVLTSDKHNHWVSALAGRQLIQGFRGWIWTEGLDYWPLEQDVRKMFAGEEFSLELLKKYNVRFVVIGYQERRDYQANEVFFQSRFPKVLRNDEYNVYKITN